MNQHLSRLRQAIHERTAVVAVVGLGYVGLPVACEFARVGFRVIGVDVKQDRVDLINQGISPIEGNEPGLADLLRETVQAGRLRATTDAFELAVADVITVNVETPVDEDNRPRYAALRAALTDIAEVIKDGALVIVESTIAPGTIESLVRPALESGSGQRVDDDIFLGHCPERVMPGRLLANLRGLSRVCGGNTPETASVMVDLYRPVVQADLDTADCQTAELVKTAENAYRDVNIAFANELALVCESVGADVLRVRELVNKSPGRNVLMPGAGVGGHCIPKDPWLLAAGAAADVPIRLIPAARAVNEHMPIHIMKLIQQGLSSTGQGLRGARVAILGYAYLENSDDSRHSPSQALINVLENEGALPVVHDPLVPGFERDVATVVAGSAATIAMVAHDEYRRLDLALLRSIAGTPLLVDGRHLFERGSAEAAGWTYVGVGRGRALAGTVATAGR